jgi:PRTRC genetic system protein A
LKSTPHPMDVIRQAMTPTVMVPSETPFVTLEEPGHRFLAAKDGLWMEVKTEWLYLRYPIAIQKSVQLPYGPLALSIEFTYGAPPIDLLQRFQNEAREASPGQAFAWVTWSQLKGFSYYRLERKPAAGGPEAAFPDLVEGEHLVFNLHSHGVGPAFFSDEDFAFNPNGVFFTGVYGRCQREIQDSKYVLMAKALRIEMDDVFTMLTQ